MCSASTMRRVQKTWNSALKVSPMRSRRAALIRRCSVFLLQTPQIPGKVTQAIQGALSSDSKVDAIFTLGSAIAADAVRAVQQQNLGDKVKIGSVDLSTAVLKQIKDGKIAFTIDQQPYLQGYYAVSILARKCDLWHALGWGGGNRSACHR